MGYETFVKILADDRAAKYNRLQKVYETIKEERPWDIRPGNKIYTTTKEKYMIKLILDGYDIPDTTIDHVVNRCFEIPHSLPDGQYSCWFGFLQPNGEFDGHNYINCSRRKSQHKINDCLQCYNGALYYPVDMMKNPFGSWQPEVHGTENCLNGIIDALNQKWPKNWYDDELHKYTLKYLMSLIKEGEVISIQIINHVVDGCFHSYHRVDFDHFCCFGFILKKGFVHDFGSCTSDHDISDVLHCNRGVLKYIMNKKYYQNTGIRSITISELRHRKYLTSQHSLAENVRFLNMQKVDRVWIRIKFKDLISPFLEHRMCTTWQERHLLYLMTNGTDLTNDVITHALEGCYTWGHMLNDEYGCCRGYIVDKSTFLEHEFSRCMLNHNLTEYLKCNRGKFYHRNDEVPFGI